MVGREAPDPADGTEMARRGRAGRAAGLIRARDDEQVLGELSEAVGLLPGREDRVPELRPGALGCGGELELGLEDGQGVRISWLASARSSRSRERASSSRASIALSVSPSRAISSLEAGTGSRWPGDSAETRAARARIASTGRSAPAATP